MTTFLLTLEKHLTGLLLANVPLALLLVVAVVALAVVVTIRYNKKITEALADRERAATVEGQQKKIMQLVEAMPCVSKANATWLQDKSKNGGRPPDYPIKCHYHNAKERGEK